MIEVAIEEMHGSDRVSEPEIDYERAWVGDAQFINESEMALFPECKESCAQKVVDTADIVRCDVTPIETSACPIASSDYFLFANDSES
jgi:hypothetical protein